MQEIVGRTFSVADGQYRVVDVRRLNGEALVYAEALGGEKDSESGRPQRMAFHYGDIAELVDTENKIA